MKISTPYLLFLGNAHDDLAAKTAFGIARWRPEHCVGQFSLPTCKTSVGLPELTLECGLAAGAKTLVVGVADRGGRLPDDWIAVLQSALELGFDLAAGLHIRLKADERLRRTAEIHGRSIFDVRVPDKEFPVGTGAPRAGKRLLTVGTDCSVGKMYTTLAVDLEMRRRGFDVDFRATGQTGILISGAGVSVDAVVGDFIAGATEWLCPVNDDDHWDVVEGQGSLHHPSYAGISLALLHGAQPDALVLCHEPTREHMRGLPHQPLPDIAISIEANETAARIVNPNARCIGLSLNTSKLAPEEALRLKDRLSAEFSLPCVDPMVDGVGPIVDQLS